MKSGRVRNGRKVGSLYRVLLLRCDLVWFELVLGQTLSVGTVLCAEECPRMFRNSLRQACTHLDLDLKHSGVVKVCTRTTKDCRLK